MIISEPEFLLVLTLSFADIFLNFLKQLLDCSRLDNEFYADICIFLPAITWYRNKQTASSRRCPALQKAEIFLKVMEARIKDIEVLHWDNRLWGEIPADFGNK